MTMTLPSLLRRRCRTYGLRAAAAFCFAVMLLPIFFICWLSFFKNQILSFPPEGYTLHWFAALWLQPQLAGGFVTSLEVATLAMLGGLAVGIPASLALVRAELPLRETLNTLLLSPLVVPVTGNPSEGSYAATKGGVDGLTKTVALEVAKDNISVNAIAACGIDAPGDVFQQWMEKEHITPAQAGAMFPIGRMGTADELTAAVLFLCSDQARFIVGHLLVIDGGFTAH